MVVVIKTFRKRLKTRSPSVCEKGGGHSEKCGEFSILSLKLGPEHLPGMPG